MKFLSVSPYALLASALLLSNAGFLWYNFNTVRAHQDWIRHSDQVIHEIDLIYSSVKESEAGIRGFVLNRETTSFEEFQRGQVEAWEHLYKVRNLVQDNGNQETVLASVELALRSRMQALEKIHQLILSSNPGEKFEGHPIFRTGQALMENLRHQLSNLKAEEERLLLLRDERAFNSQRNFHIALILTTFASILIITWSLTQIWRNQRRAQAVSALQAEEAEIQKLVAELAQELAKPLPLKEISQHILQKLSTDLPLTAANLYLHEDSQLLHLSSFAEDHSNLTSPRKVKMGEGLIGEAFRRDDIWQVSDIPENYLMVSSTLGKAPPKFLVFVPLKFEGQKLGVMEIAFFSQLSEQESKLLERQRLIIASGLNSALWRERLQNLLEKTQEQSEELKSQQEELRANNEELEQQTEELQAQQEELRSSNDELSEQARLLEEQQQVLKNKTEELDLAKRIAERRALDLTKANQYKSDFLAKMSHELRTPLNSLLILTSLLIENKEKNLSPQQQEFAQSIYGAGHDLLSLINDILDLSKMDAQKLNLRPEKFTVQSLADHLQKTFELQFQSKNLKFEIQLSQEIREANMHTDRQRVEQVLRNFLSNALKFTQEGQVQLIVEPGEKEGWIRFSVQDSGIGIEENKKDLIFEAFEQADSSVSRRYGGTGLGLTISKELASLLGGNVSLQTEVGQGSRFTLEIPMQLSEQILKSEEKKPSLGPAVSAESAETRPQMDMILKDLSSEMKSILIIEDEPQIQRQISRIAQEGGYQPICVASAEMALDLLREHQPKGIFLDLDLPGLGGKQLMQNLKLSENLKSIPIQIISGDSEALGVEGLEVLGRLKKPLKGSEIRSAFHHLKEIWQPEVRKILVVEDNERQKDAIVQLISGRNLEVSTATNGGEALQMIQSANYDCIILDLELPDVSGFDVLERLRTQAVQLPPIVIYTGREITEQEEETLRRFSESIIIKGARSPERLVDEVHLFLNQKANINSFDKNQIPEESFWEGSEIEGKTVLLVDDDLRNVFALAHALEAWGLNVRIARNGFEALQMLEEDDDIEIVLMDLMMPKMDGFEAIRRVRAHKQFSRLPIIALTAKTAPESKAKCLEAGANDYLPKPIQLANLRSVLKVWLSSERMHR
ncbi:MAG: response regulator [Pseudobdellovibrionaceae bacterium]